MSARYAVGTSPVQILYGTQYEPQLVLNSGTQSAYLSDDSNPSAGYDFTLGAGDSLVVDPETVLWATADSPGTTLTTLNNYGDRFAPSAPVGRLLTSVNLTGGTSASYTFTVGGGIGSHVPGVWAAVKSGGTALYSTLPTGIWSITYKPDGNATSHMATWYNAGAAVGAGSYASGDAIVAVWFPNEPSQGGTLTLTLPAGFVGVFEVWATDESTPNTVPGVTQAAQAFTAQTWTQYGNTWSCSPTITAGAATTDVYLPPIPGPIHYTIVLTTGGAASLTCSLRQVLTAATNIIYEPLFINGTTGGTLSALGNEDIWPTSTMFLRFILGAGATVSAAQLTLTSASI